MESTEARKALSVLMEVTHASRFWRITLALLLGAVIYLALDTRPAQSLDTGWDKLNHLLAFAVLAATGALGFPRNWGRVATGLLAFGALVELLQSLTPSRFASGWDLLANAVGIAIGLGLAGGLLKTATCLGQP